MANKLSSPPSPSHHHSSVTLPLQKVYTPDKKNVDVDNELKKEHKVLHRNTSLFQAGFGLCKSALGVGALLLASSLRDVGFFYIVLILIFASITTTISLHFLGRISANTGYSDYGDIGRLAMGMFGENLSLLAVMAFLVGTLFFFILYAASSFLHFFTVFFSLSLSAMDQERYLVYAIIITSIPIFLMGLLRDMKALAKANLVGMACCVLVLLIIILSCIICPFKEGGLANIPLYWSATAPEDGWSSFLYNLTTIFSKSLFAFVSHFSIIANVPSLVDPTRRRRNKLVLVCGAVLLIVNFLFTLCSLIILPGAEGSILDVDFSKIGGDVSNRFAAFLKYIFAFGSFLIGLNLILSYPLMLHPFRSSVESVLRKAGGWSIDPKTISPFNIVITLLIVLSVTVPNVAFVKEKDIPREILDLMVAFSGPLLLFIFPSVFFLKIGGEKCSSQLIDGESYRIEKWERYSAYALIVLGTIVLVCGVRASIDSIIEIIFK